MKADPEIFELHRHVDGMVAQIAASARHNATPITCSRGCFACCFEPVYADRREVEHALGRLTPERRQQVKAATQDWLDKVLPSGLLDQYRPKVWDWRSLRAPCPFLEKGDCMIYEDRPSECRIHCAIGPPSNCYDEQARRHQKFAACPTLVSAFAKILVAFRKPIETGHLGLFLAEILLHKKIPSAAHCKHDPAAVRALHDELSGPCGIERMRRASLTTVALQKR